MARIRSVHPGLFTDENYAVLSFPARELLKGLWIESDDNGIFEWKPLSIKMRIFPADQVDVPALLQELTAAWVQPFDYDGKRYGACKNFGKYQRPKKPKTVHPLPDALKSYVMHGYKPRHSEQVDDEQQELETGTEPVPHQFSTDTEKSGQMEEGGGKMEDGDSTTSAAASPPAPALGLEFIRLPTNRFEKFSEEVPIYEAFLAELQCLYPAVDVRAELRAMRAWLLTHDRQRKTRGGMKRFVNGWLARSHDKKSTRETFNGSQNGTRTKSTPHDRFIAAGLSLLNGAGQDGGGGAEGQGDDGINEPFRPLLSA